MKCSFLAHCASTEEACVRFHKRFQASQAVILCPPGARWHSLNSCFSPPLLFARDGALTEECEELPESMQKWTYLPEWAKDCWDGLSFPWLIFLLPTTPALMLWRVASLVQSDFFGLYYLILWIAVSHGQGTLFAAPVSTLWEYNFQSASLIRTAFWHSGFWVCPCKGIWHQHILWTWPDRNSVSTGTFFPLFSATKLFSSR